MISLLDIMSSLYCDTTDKDDNGENSNKKEDKNLEQQHSLIKDDVVSQPEVDRLRESNNISDLQGVDDQFKPITPLPLTHTPPPRPPSGGGLEKEAPYSVEEDADNFLTLVDKWTGYAGGDGNNFLPPQGSIPPLRGGAQGLYDFLDSLTLLEESAFLHIFIFIYILCCVANIISVFFGNEIIRYFNLEERYPKLSIYFKLRAKFQRYYLAWNILGIIFMSVLAIGLNLLVFYSKW